jgi:hypothetical protein
MLGGEALAPLGLQGPFFDVRHGGLPILIRQAVHGLKEPRLIRQIPGQHFLNQFIRIAALFGGAVHQLFLHVVGEMDFHGFASFF